VLEWRSYGYGGEGRGWLERLLRLDDHVSGSVAKVARHRGLHAADWLASDQQDFVAAARLFEESTALRRELGETEEGGALAINAARKARAAGHYRQATTLLENVLPGRGHGDRAHQHGTTLMSMRILMPQHAGASVCAL